MGIIKRGFGISVIKGTGELIGIFSNEISIADIAIALTLYMNSNIVSTIKRYVISNILFIIISPWGCVVQIKLLCDLARLNKNT